MFAVNTCYVTTKLTQSPERDTLIKTFKAVIKVAFKYANSLSTKESSKTIHITWPPFCFHPNGLFLMNFKQTVAVPFLQSWQMEH